MAWFAHSQYIYTTIPVAVTTNTPPQIISPVVNFFGRNGLPLSSQNSSPSAWSVGWMPRVHLLFDCCLPLICLIPSATALIRTASLCLTPCLLENNSKDSLGPLAAATAVAGRVRNFGGILACRMHGGHDFGGMCRLDVTLGLEVVDIMLGISVYTTILGACGFVPFQQSALEKMKSWSIDDSLMLPMIAKGVLQLAIVHGRQ